MVLSGERCLAIEAKWTEPRYETVAEWLASSKTKRSANAQLQEKSSNREKVLAGWHKLIQSRIPTIAPVGDFSNAIYQMVHRTASACVRSQPQLGYLQFKLPSKRDSSCTSYWDDLAELHKLLGSPRSFPFNLIEIEVVPTSAFDDIQNLEKGPSRPIQKFDIPYSISICSSLDRQRFDQSSFVEKLLGTSPRP
jgi:hypothetical protein